MRNLGVKGRHEIFKQRMSERKARLRGSSSEPDRSEGETSEAQDGRRGSTLEATADTESYDDRQDS